MQKSGFFNAMLVEGEYDRKYNANDYCDNLAVVISNGVLRSTDDDLKVTSNGLLVSVGVGRAWIDGHYYYNDTPHTFAAVSAPIGGTRYDRVFLRLNRNLSVRSVSLVYQQGEAADTPTKPAPVREGNIYDLVLADIYIDTNATSVTVTDTRGDTELCGWVYSTSGDQAFLKSIDATFNAWFDNAKDTLASVTLFKCYNWRTVLTSPTNTVTFNIPQYDAETCFFDVYVNGILATEGVDYTAAGSKLTFAGTTLIAGTEIEVKCYKSIDGTGIMSISDEITELQNAVAALNTTGEYEYICNGVNDNVVIGDIVRAYLDGGTDYGSTKLNIIGNLGMSVPARGSGTSVSPYAWFNFNVESNRKIIIDFSRSGQIAPTIIDGTYNNIFSVANAHIIGATVIATNTAVNTVIRIFDTTSGALCAENCRFWITSYQDSRVGQTGTFNNCRASVANVINNSYCFLPFTESLLRINGGEYYAYTGSSSAQSSVVGQSAANSVSILYGVNAPTVARSGYYQTNSVLQWAGGGVLSCTDLISELPLIVVAGISNIRGTIAKNKPGAM